MLCMRSENCFYQIFQKFFLNIKSLEEDLWKRTTDTILFGSLFRGNILKMINRNTKEMKYLPRANSFYGYNCEYFRTLYNYWDYLEKRRMINRKNQNKFWSIKRHRTHICGAQGDIGYEDLNEGMWHWWQGKILAVIHQVSH